MDNEILIEKSWWQRYWKWIMIGGLAMIFAVALFSATDNQIGDFAKAYADMPLYENAIAEANTNERVAEVFGRLQPIDKMTIAEGNINYSEDGKSVSSTITVKGEKAKAKMDIEANRTEAGWEYTGINIRVKDPNEEIVILKKQ
ncbi:MAG: hypothetical protein EOO45_11100 [Flavobacterium sp.]|nr:MAG: hypothetical protein EOO45_11100 [Flavobacterium sp.]